MSYQDIALLCSRSHCHHIQDREVVFRSAAGSGSGFPDAVLYQVGLPAIKGWRSFKSTSSSVVTSQHPATHNMTLSLTLKSRDLI